jgi:hypothetical protein
MEVVLIAGIENQSQHRHGYGSTSSSGVQRPAVSLGRYGRGRVRVEGRREGARRVPSAPPEDGL